MSSIPSNQKPSSTDFLPFSARNTPEAPVVLGNGNLLVLALVRIFVGYLWFQQLFWKMPPDFAGLRRYVVEEGQFTFVPGYSYIIQHVFLPNFILLGAATWTAELLVGISLMFGFLSRFGALLSILLAAQLYAGLAVARGEWYWTYGMLVLLGIALTAIPAGRRLGVDQWLATRLRAGSGTNRVRRVLQWFV